MIKVGVSTVDITPPIGVELCGYGYYLSRVSTGVLDRLMARALYVETAESQLLIIASDLCGMDRELTLRTRGLLQERLGLSPESVMLTATHTHSGPATMTLHGCGERDQLYCAHLPFAWRQAAEEAVAAARPASMAVAAGPVTPIGQDRYCPGGPTDAALRLVRFDIDGQPRALLLNHSAHAVCFGPRNTQISGDWPGRFQRHVEALLPGCTALFLQGACGTINPIQRSLAPGADGAVIDAVGAALAREAVALAHEAASVNGPESVQCTLEQLPLVAEIPTREQLAATRDAWLQAREATETPEFENGMARLHAAVSQHLLDHYPQTGALSYKAELHTVRLGPVRLIGIPGELFMSLGQEILDSLPNQTALLVGYANDWIGYFPSRDAYSDPRYEYATHHAPYLRAAFPFKPGAGEAMVAATTRA